MGVAAGGQPGRRYLAVGLSQPKASNPVRKKGNNVGKIKLSGQYEKNHLQEKRIARNFVISLALAVTGHWLQSYAASVRQPILWVRVDGIVAVEQSRWSSLGGAVLRV